MQYGQFPDPRFTIAHLSDVHLLSPGRKQYDAIVPEMGLMLVLERLSRLTPVPDALVFTGDLADKAEPAAYARLRELVEPFAASIGAQVVWVMGNHDERAPYAKGLFDRDLGPATTSRRRTRSTTSTGCGSSRSTPARRATTTAS